MEWNENVLWLDDDDARALGIVVDPVALDHVIRGKLPDPIKVIVSAEFVMDWINHDAMLGADRAGPFTDEDLEDWIDILDKLNGINECSRNSFDKIKRRYRFHRAPGYEYYPYEGANACDEELRKYYRDISEEPS